MDNGLLTADEVLGFEFGLGGGSPLGAYIEGIAKFVLTALSGSVLLKGKTLVFVPTRVVGDTMDDEVENLGLPFAVF